MKAREPQAIVLFQMCAVRGESEVLLIGRNATVAAESNITAFAAAMPVWVPCISHSCTFSNGALLARLGVNGTEVIL
jgi:hypothetical protein